MPKFYFDNAFDGKYSESEIIIFKFFFENSAEDGLRLGELTKFLIPPLTEWKLRSGLRNLEKKMVVTKNDFNAGAVNNGSKYFYSLTTMAKKGHRGFCRFL